MNNTLRRLRGALGTAVTWGATWFGGVALFMTSLYVGGYDHPLLGWEFILGSASNAGLAGLLAGAAFAAYTRLAYVSRDLLEIKASGFALGGAVVAGAIGIIGGEVVAAALIGAATSWATIRLAQSSARALRDPEPQPLLAGVDSRPAEDSTN